jgi:toxin ETX/toxin MTX2
MSSLPGEAVSEDEGSGALRLLWASGGSRDLTSPMEGWLGDDGRLTLQQMEQGAWKEKWNNGFSDPIVSFEAAKMNYDFDKAVITANTPKTSAKITGENHLNHPPAQEVTLAISYAESTSISFKTTTTLKIGAKTTLKTGIPGIVDGEVEMSTEITQGFEWNKTTVNTVTKTATVKVSVPPCQSVIAWMAWTESTFAVPYTCQGIGIFASGARMPANVTGVYDGIAAQELLLKWIPGKPVCETADPSWLAAGEHTEPVRT